MSKIIKYIVGIVATAVALFLIWYFSNIVTYILISAVLAIIGKPLVTQLLKIHFRSVRIPKWVAALISLSTIWAVGVAFFVLFIPLVFSKVNEISAVDIQKFMESFRQPLDHIDMVVHKFFALKQTAFSVTDAITSQFETLLNVNLINQLLSSTVSIVTGGIIALFSITFITFFFLKEDHLFFEMVKSLFPSKYEENITRALDSITLLLIRYFTGILAESTIIMFVISLVLILFGMGTETAFFIGLVMGVMNVVPYIGPLIGAGLSVFMAVISPIEGMAAVNMVMIVGGTIICVKGLDDFVLQPLLYSSRVNAHPLEIFLVILIAGSVAGVLGMLLAIPSYNVIRVFAKEFFNNFRLVQKLTQKM